MGFVIALAVTILLASVAGFLNYQAWKPSPPYMKDAVAEWLFRAIAGSITVLMVCFLWSMVWSRTF